MSCSGTSLNTNSTEPTHSTDSTPTSGTVDSTDKGAGRNTDSLNPPASETPEVASGPGNPAHIASLIQILSPELTLELKVNLWDVNNPSSGASILATLKNTSTSISYSQVQIRVDAPLSIWSMELVSQTNTETIVKLPSYQALLAAGATYDFGFSISPYHIPNFSLISFTRGTSDGGGNNGGLDAGINSSIFVSPFLPISSLNFDSHWTDFQRAQQISSLMNQNSFYDENYFSTLVRSQHLLSDRACTVRIPSYLQNMQTQMLIGRPSMNQNISVSNTPINLRLVDKYFALFLVYAQDQYGFNPHMLMGLGAKESFFGAVASENDNSYFIVDGLNDYFNGYGNLALEQKGYFRDGNKDGPFQMETPTFAGKISAFPQRFDFLSTCASSLTAEACRYLPRDMHVAIVAMLGNSDLYEWGELQYGLLITNDSFLLNPFFGNLLMGDLNNRLMTNPNPDLEGYHDKQVLDFYKATVITALDLHYREAFMFGLSNFGRPSGSDATSGPSFREVYDLRNSQDDKDRLELAALMWSYNRGLFTGMDLSHCSDPIQQCGLDGFGQHTTNIQNACQFLNSALDQNNIYDFQISSVDVSWFIHKLRETYPFQEVHGLQGPLDWNLIELKSQNAFLLFLSNYRLHLNNPSQNTISFRYHWRSLLAVIRSYLPPSENPMGPSMMSAIYQNYGGAISSDSRIVPWPE